MLAPAGAVTDVEPLKQGGKLIGCVDPGLNIELNLRGQVDATGPNVSNLSGVVVGEDALHGKSVGLSIRDHLVGDEGRCGCALICETSRSVREDQDSTFSGRKTAVLEEVGVARLGISRIAHIVRARVLGREGEGSQIIEQDIGCHAEAGTNRGLVIRRVVDADTG